MIYRLKDVIEKGFDRMKDDPDFSRLRIWKDRAAINKDFAGSIALILTCAIDRIMSEKNLFRNYTIKELLGKFSFIKITEIEGVRILHL